ncbi:MAG: hypothetical protein KIT62_16535 [Cyclobacteriaceae bacterium]|nr:hypothetical protein [Cyclobacteriaceae bacterium]
MKFSQYPNYLKAAISMVLLWGFLHAALPAAFANSSDPNSSETQAADPGSFKDASAVSGEDLKGSHVPAQNKNAEPQTETEPKAEEEDTNEKDSADLHVGLVYRANRSWIITSACSGNVLVRIAGTTRLYILYHSWKHFLL